MKAIIFDMDGIILDTESIVQDTWTIAGKEFNFDDITNTLKECLGTNKKQTLEILISKYDDSYSCKKFLERTSELFQEIELSKGINLMPFAKELLEYVKNKYKIGLASSTRNVVVKRQLKNAGVLDYFEVIVTGDMVKNSKPDPEIYLKACNELDVLPKDAYAIEDSPNGIMSAFNAGLKTIMIPDRIKPNEEIKNYTWKVLPSLKNLIEIL